MKKRLCSLDIIKVVCTIIILLHHFQLETGFITSKVNMASGKIYCGYVVEFFFIISGFVTSMQIEGISHQKFGDYLKKKAIRLYPMTIISILVNLMIIVVFYCTFGYWWRDSAPGMWKMLCSLFLLFSGGVIKDVPYGIYVCC